MFTTGSKFFFGSAAIAAVAAIVFATSSGDPFFTGTIVLAGLVITASFLGGVVTAFRDATRPASAGPEVLAPPHQAAPFSVWPILVAFAAGVAALGLAVDRRAYLLGLIALLVLGMEWAVQGWADGASGDPGYNRAVRGRFMHALEYPVLGALGVGFVAFLFSRLMLTLNENGAVVVFVALGAIILGGAVVLAQAPALAKKALPVFLVVGAAGLLAAGIVGISRGEADHTELAEKSGKAVADKANPEAIVRITDGQLSAPTLVIPKGINANILFRNDDAGERRMVVKAVHAVKNGTQTTTEPLVIDTELIGEGKVALITVRLPKSGSFEYLVVDKDWVTDDATPAHVVATGKVIVP